MGDLSSTQVWCHVSHGLQGKRHSGSQGPLAGKACPHALHASVCVLLTCMLPSV